MTQLHSSRDQGQQATSHYVHHQPTCCAFVSNILSHSHQQVQYYYSLLQSKEVELQKAQDKQHHSQRCLDKERMHMENLKQQFLDLEARHSTLKDDHHNTTAQNAELSESVQMLSESVQLLRDSVQTAERFAEEVSKQCERTILAGETDAQIHHDISGLILESTKNKLLVEAMSRAGSEDDLCNSMKCIIDQNVELQQQIADESAHVSHLHGMLEERDKMLEERDNEIASFEKAMELVSTEESPRKKTLRGKAPKVTTQTG